MQDLIDIVLKVKAKITDDSDVVWTRFDNPAAMRNEIDSCIQQLQNNNLGELTTLHLLFAPTGSFQEHAISNGWIDEYMRLAEEFDRLYAQASRSY